MNSHNPHLSIVIPVHNEALNIKPLVNELHRVLIPLKKSYELIYIDDASTDATGQEILACQRELALHETFEKEDYGQGKAERLLETHSFWGTLVYHRMEIRMGQSYGSIFGIKQAKGALIFTMDGDLQHVPNDIPRFLSVIENSLDDVGMVCGFRYQRQDSWKVKWVSKLANRFRKMFTDDDVSDAGCTFRVIQKKCANLLFVNDKEWYGVAHLFFPALLKHAGFKVLEIPISHRARLYHQSKYSLIRGRAWVGGLGCLKAQRLGKKAIIPLYRA